MLKEVANAAKRSKRSIDIWRSLKPPVSEEAGSDWRAWHSQDTKSLHSQHLGGHFTDIISEANLSSAVYPFTNLKYL
jgi:hypothetical protein